MDKTNILNKLKEYSSDYQEEIISRDRIINFIENNNDFYTKKNLNGHITCSAWIINSTYDHILLTHHAKMNIWLQLGGHIEPEDKSVFLGALREAYEESGLKSIKPISKEIFDLDVHFIPAYKETPEHYHYDIRFIFQSDNLAELIISEESKDLKWFSFDDFRKKIDEWSMLRMLDKTIKLL